ncbi:MAG TPA: SGNH/GDSL hydrolase family protein [Polyangiales bacterium]|nr:SGNH/GDSL hydrolase family protein [Polyangiales bacterium]
MLLVLVRVVPSALAALRRTPELSEGAAGALVQPAAQSTAKPLRVLFVGNSHTFVNDMPLLVAQLAAAGHEARPFVPALVTKGGATLEQHLAQGTLREPLEHGPWDYVVLQEQQQRPTFAPEEVERFFFTPARTLDVLVRAAGARTVLYMTAARRDGDGPGDTYEAMQARSIRSHQQLARELGALTVPAGPAWQSVRRERPDLQLWQPDGMHPSLAGSYLIACVFYAVLYAHSPLDNRFTAGLPDDVAQVLQRAAEVARNM